MNRGIYVLKRLALGVPVLIFGLSMAFLVLELSPIDPVLSILGRDAKASDIRRLEIALHLRYPNGSVVPLWDRYLQTITDLLTLDFGQSWTVQRDTAVVDLIANRIPATLWLGFWSVLIALAVGIPVGLYAGLRANTWGDYTASAGGILWRAMPNFWLAVMLAGLITAGGALSGYRQFMVKTDVVGTPDALGRMFWGIDLFPWELPGFVPDVVSTIVQSLAWIPIPTTDQIQVFLGLPNPLDADIMLFGPVGLPNPLQPDVMIVNGAEMAAPVALLTAFKWILPAALVLGSASMGNEVRIGRTAVLESLNSKYIETAKAKGLRSRAIIGKHVGRNAMIPLLPIIMGEFYLLIGGSVIVEKVFSINGIGNLFLQAVTSTDIPVVLALVFFFIIIQILFNITQDLLYTYIDPRITLGERGG